MWLDAKYLNPFFTRRLTQEVGMSNPLPAFRPAVARSGEGSHFWRLVSSPALPLLPSLPYTPWKMADRVWISLLPSGMWISF